MQLTNIFDYLDGLKYIANVYGYGFDFDICDVIADDNEQIISVRLYSKTYERYAKLSSSYTSILDSRNPRDLAMCRFRQMMSSFQSI